MSVLPEHRLPQIREAESREAWAMVKTRSSRLRTKKRVRILIGTDSNLSPETSLALCAVIRAAEHFVNIEMVLQSAWLHPDYDIGMVLRVSSGKLDPHITAVLSISNRDTIFRDKICTGFLDEDDNYYSSGIRVANKPSSKGNGFGLIHSLTWTPSINSFCCYWTSSQGR